MSLTSFEIMRLVQKIIHRLKDSKFLLENVLYVRFRMTLKFLTSELYYFVDSRTMSHSL